MFCLWSPPTALKLYDLLGSSYYCGLSALKTGVDSVHLFCDAAAASVIRHYTSEMVIHPVLDQVLLS